MWLKATNANKGTLINIDYFASIRNVCICDCSVLCVMNIFGGFTVCQTKQAICNVCVHVTLGFHYIVIDILHYFVTLFYRPTNNRWFEKIVSIREFEPVAETVEIMSSIKKSSSCSKDSE